MKTRSGAREHDEFSNSIFSKMKPLSRIAPRAAYEIHLRLFNDRRLKLPNSLKISRGRNINDKGKYNGEKHGSAS